MCCVHWYLMLLYLQDGRRFMKVPLWRMLCGCLSIRKFCRFHSLTIIKYVRIVRCRNAQSILQGC